MEAAVFQRLQRTAGQRPQSASTAALLARAAQLIGGDLEQVRERVRQLAATPPRPAADAALHLIDGGGKAVRPLLTLLCARAVGGSSGAAIPHAAAAELVHCATLLHDDVIDDGQTRRGRSAARVVWGNTVSVLSGDLLFVQAMQLVEEAGPPEILRTLMQTVSRLVEGEVLQHELRGRFIADETLYDDIVECKTASLFRWCARAGAVAGGGAPDEIAVLERYGTHVGRAFQVRDDVLDLAGDPATLGKGLARDLEEGKLTLPAIRAVARQPGLITDLQRVAGSGTGADPALVAAVVDGIRAAGGLDEARLRVEQELRAAEEALDDLAVTPALEVLRALASVLAVRQD